MMRLFYLKLNHFADINATVVSSMRFEKPHSLSYQLPTLTKRPDTLVRLVSYDDEAGSWLKSTDTYGAVTELRIPLSAPSEAVFMMLLISSTDVSRAATKDKSTNDTLIVGTRMA